MFFLRNAQSDYCFVGTLLIFFAAIYALFAGKKSEFSRSDLESQLGVPLTSIEDIQKFYNIYCSPMGVNISTASDVFLTNDHYDERDLLSEPLTTDTLGNQGDVVFLEQPADSPGCLQKLGAIGNDKPSKVVTYNSNKLTCRGWGGKEAYMIGEALMQQYQDVRKQKHDLSAKISTHQISVKAAKQARKKIEEHDAQLKEIEYQISFNLTIIRNRDLKEKMKRRREELREQRTGSGNRTFYSMGAGHFYKLSASSSGLKAKPFKTDKPPVFDGRHEELRTFLEDEKIRYCALQPKTHVRSR